jgi:hypothetical protein
MRSGVEVREVRALPASLAGAPMFLTNSLIGVRAVSHLDGAELPQSALILRLQREIA